MANSETVGELVERLGEREAMNFLVAQSISLRMDIGSALSDLERGRQCDAEATLRRALNGSS